MTPREEVIGERLAVRAHALVHLVQAQTTPVREATLRRLGEQTGQTDRRGEVPDGPGDRCEQRDRRGACA
jgi:hypothetical protein